MKKSLKLIGVTCLLVSLLVGCGSEVAEDTTKSTTENDATETVMTEEVVETTEVTENTEAELDLEKIKELEAVNLKLVEVYNDVAVIADGNNWGADALTLEEINTVKLFIDLNNSVILDQTNITNSDVDELISSANVMMVEMDTNLRERVSVPYVVPAE